MRKEITTLFLGLACAMGVQAQEYNLFYDVDENGWLWFDSQEKIDKYVGLCDQGENFRIDPNGKPIQLVYAYQYPDYPATTVDPTYTGAGLEGELGAEGAITGSIILPPATGLTAYSNADGGGIVVLMPSCSTFSLSLSCEGPGYVHMSGTKDINTLFPDYTVISSKYSVWSPRFSAGTYVWTGIETLDNNNEDESLRLRLQSDSPVYGYFRSASTSTMYIHGIRVTTPTNSTLAVRDVTAKQQQTRIFLEGERVVLNEPADIRVYNASGLLMDAATHTDRMDLSSLPGGIYIVKAGDAIRKVALK